MRLLAALALAALGARAADHSPWNAWLSRYLDATGRAAYGAVTPADKASLAAYLESLQAEKVSALPKPERKAFWINLYNARTVAEVLGRFPIRSILDVKPWDAKLLRVEGRALSLNDIENGILRPIWKDPLVHFGLNCASLGCPDLPPVALNAANCDSLLAAGARRFLASDKGAAFAGDTLKLSSLFDWYKSDFGPDDHAVLEFLARYAPAAKAARLRTHKGPIRYQYDWNLNAR